MKSGCSLPICAMVNIMWDGHTMSYLHKQENIMGKMRIPNNAGMITIVYQYVDHVIYIMYNRRKFRSQTSDNMDR